MALGGFAAAAIALTPLIATITFESPPVTITLLDPAPARGRVEHATVAGERDESTPVSGTTGSVTPGEPAPLDVGGPLTDDDPIAGLDPSEPAQRLGSIERIERLDSREPIARAEPVTSDRTRVDEPGEAAVEAALVSPQAARVPAIVPRRAAGGPAAPAPRALEEPATAPTAALITTRDPETPAGSLGAEPADATAEPAELGTASATTEATTASATTEPPTPSATTEPAVARAPASFDQLLEGAVPREATTAPAPRAPEPDLPATPRRDDVDRALESVRPAVRACAQAAHGVANVRITVAGSSGRVVRALVEGDLAGTPTGSCVARAVRSAEFGRFEQSSFTVLYPFRI